MTKLTLSDVGDLRNSTTAKNTINANSALIETAFDNTLSRDGTTPNTMSSNLDMNSFRVMNLPTPATANEPLRLADITAVDGIFITASTGTSGHYVPFLDGNNTHSGNNTFSGTNTFSGSNTFSSSNTFSGSNTFSSTNTFSNSNTFSGNNTHSGTNTFSAVNSFTSTSGTRFGNNIASGLARVSPTQPFPIFLDRLISWTVINDDGIVDASDITPVDSTSNQYCSFAAYTRVTNTAFNLNHVCGFEDLKQYLGSGTLTDEWSFLSSPTVSGPVTNRKAFYTKDPQGAGVITNNYGFYADSLTRGTNNWAFYSAGAASFFGGTILASPSVVSLPTGPVGVFNRNTSAPRNAATTGSDVLHVQGADGSGAWVTIDCYNNGGGGSSGIVTKTARGTNASPAAVQANDTLFAFGNGAYHSGGAFTTFSSVMQANAAENFTNTAQGTYWNWYVTTPTTTTLAERMRLGQGLMLNTFGTDPGAGALIASSSIKSSGATAGIGYATGAGGAVTQITSRTTGVTLNTISGAITMFNAAGSTTAATFTVTNSAVAATDTITLNQKSGTNLYNFIVTAVAAGSFNITFYTTGGTSSDAPVINFNVIKGVAA